ncbi:MULTISPECIES: DUF3099 domain-containing protein [Streptomyces]|uniref:DUF3099 domain-containing protein n=1 Tax=Streptomyces fradiae ATCC 10745 = DSM 40063 TaxID=1319510 RepID=A0A1Y2NXI8_STRFR|nr:MULTISPECIES: DUF3099 domain-containing protein [Streptomyces]KAF0648010.1 hypothetical protein K701_20475 [Streptomyces fradiae ATCC 10745 = DSM 40063]OSY52245.1 hypothetical protein BG846_02085 [Streptomyces fradiae ATCC 10745 = DSM 40063]QEV11550.1 DUF3099 domain-containing protein [Streptomyces fradiae ATCC 10745 = DSM 40063]
MRKHGGAQVFTITGARQGLADDVRGRQRRYVISMSVRTLSVIAAAALWNVERHVAIVALVLGAVLPYVAVVIANAGRETTPKLPSTFVSTPPVAYRALEAPGSGADDGTPGPEEAGAGAGPASGEPEGGSREPGGKAREPRSGGGGAGKSSDQ